MFPTLLGEMVDLANSGGLSREITRTGLILLAILIAQALFAYTRTRLFVVVTERTLASIRQHIYNHLIQAADVILLLAKGGRTQQPYLI